MTRSEQHAPARHEARDPSPDVEDRAAARAALTLCESLVLALADARMLGAEEMRGVLEDALRVHVREGADAIDAAAARHIERMIGTLDGDGRG